MPKQRLLYRRVIFWLWVTPALPWIILACVEVLGGLGFEGGVDVIAIGLPIVATILVSLLFLLPSALICRRWVHPESLATFSDTQQRKASLTFVLHTFFVAGVLQLPLIATVRSGQMDTQSDDFTTAIVWATGSFLMSLIIAAAVGWHAIRLVRVD